MALIRPEILSQIMTEKLPYTFKMKAFTTEAMGVEMFTQQGAKIVFPRFTRLDPAQDVVKGTALVPQNQDQDKIEATVKWKGGSIRVYDQDNHEVYGHMVDNASMQLVDSMAKSFDRELINVARTTALKVALNNAAIANSSLNEALGKFGEDANIENLHGFMFHSKRIAELVALPEFVSANLTHTTANNGQYSGFVLGYFRGIPVYINDALYDSATSKDFGLLIRKDAIQYKYKKSVDVEVERESKLLANDLVASTAFACALVDAMGVVEFTA